MRAVETVRSAFFGSLFRSQDLPSSLTLAAARLVSSAGQHYPARRSRFAGKRRPCRVTENWRMNSRASRPVSGAGSGSGAEAGDERDEEFDGCKMHAHEQQLLEWAWQNGVSRDMPVRPAFCADAGCRGMVATRDIAEGETIISIPQHLLMCADTALICPIVTDVLGKPHDYGKICQCCWMRGDF